MYVKKEKVCPAYISKHNCILNYIKKYEKIKILNKESNQYQISNKAPFIICADLECLIEKIDGCKNNPKNLSTKIREHIQSGFAMSTIWLFKIIEHKHGI